MSDKSRIEELRAENVRIHKELTEMNESRAKEGEGDKPRAFTSEEHEKFERLHEAFEQNRVERERLEQLQSMGSHLDAPERTAVAQRQTADQPLADDPGAGERITSRKEYERAFEAYIREPVYGMSPELRQVLNRGFQRDRNPEKRALGDNPQTITTTGGGYAVPDAPMAALEENMLAFGGLRQAPINIVRTTGGNPWPIPTDDDTSNSGALLSINTATDDQDVTFGQVVLNAFKFTSKIILIPTEFMEDVNFDVVSWVSRKIGTRLGRGLAPYLINGDGVAEPGGLDQSTTVVNAAATNAITRNELIDLEHAVDPAYRQLPSARYVIGDDLLKAAKQLSVGTADSRPLWVPSMRDGEPDRLNGYAYHVDNEIPTLAGGNHVAYFGALEKFYLREAGGVRLYRLDERFREADQTAFVAFARYDSDIVDAGTDPIAYLRMIAS